MTNRKQRIKSHVKQHIPKDWLCDIRIAYRIAMEAVNGIKRTGIMNVFIITTMAAILAIFGALFRSTLSMSQFAHELGNVLEISVYLKDGANTSSVASRIEKINHVSKITVIPKDRSWRDLRKEIDLPNISNPLPDTLHVKVDKPIYIVDVLKEIKVGNKKIVGKVGLFKYDEKTGKALAGAKFALKANLLFPSL